MKNVLIITYFFPPTNIISAHRAKSFAENFKKHGLYPIILTRHWEGNESNWRDYEKINRNLPDITENDYCTVIRLPYMDTWYSRFCKLFHGIAPLKKLIHLLYSVFGILSPHQDTYGNFYTYIKDFLKNNDVDYILTTSTPIDIPKLGHYLAKENNIPYIADFRDLWDDDYKLLSENEESDITNRVKNYIRELYLSRWLSNASLVTAVSQRYFEHIKRLSPQAKSLVVTNGFEKELFANTYEKVKVANSRFTFSVIGTIYPEQDLSILIDGLNLFLNDKNLSEIQINFIGTAAFPEVSSKLEQNLPTECTRITERIPRDQAIEITSQSDVLFYLSWKGFKGIIPGKIFEYMASRNNVLIAPNDRDIIEKIIKETDTGELADTPKELASVLNKWFTEWKRNDGFLKYNGKSEKIDFYSREKQAELLAKEILKLNSL